MMLDLKGLTLPGSAYINPGTPLRQALTRAGVHRLAHITRDGNDYRPMARCVDEKAVVNATVGLLATGGSTNDAIHIPAFARAAGIRIDWSDMAELSHAVPLLARVYPNGASDVNMFQAAGGLGFVVGELLEAGLVHRDVVTVVGDDLAAYAQEPFLDGQEVAWRDPGPSGDDTILRGVASPFQPDGGMRLLSGNLGRAVFKTSAVEPERWTVEAPCRVFETQAAVAEAFGAGELDRDVVVVVRFQGPRANGMPELHKLTPVLGVVQDRGFKVALVTDGRMSGASGKVPAAIHVSPEALEKDGVWGPLALLRDGDVVRVSAPEGTLSTTADLTGREPAPMREIEHGTGRELFAFFRTLADEAERGASAMLAESGCD
jgi:phosphogluconate dehydratase